MTMSAKFWIACTVGAVLLAFVGVKVVDADRREQAEDRARWEADLKHKLELQRRDAAISYCRVNLEGEPVMGFDYAVVCVQPLKGGTR